MSVGMSAAQKLIQFKNEQETFDWLEENGDPNWFIETEDNEVVEISFANHRTADRAKASLPRPCN